MVWTDVHCFCQIWLLLLDICVWAIQDVILFYLPLQCLFDIIVIIQQMCWYKIRIITYLSNNNRYTIFIYLHLLIGSVYGSVSTYVCPYQRDLSVHVMCSQFSHVSVVSVQAPLQLAMSWHHVIIPHIWNFVEDRGMWIRVDFGVDHHDHDWLAQNWAIWNFVVPCKNLFVVVFGRGAINCI